MAIDPNFFSKKGNFTLLEIAKHSESEILTPSPHADDFLITDIAALDQAETGEISFLSNAKYLDHLKASQASACFVHKNYADKVPGHMACLVSQNPHRSYALATHLFYDLGVRDIGGDALHQGAVIAPTAQIGEGTIIRAGAVIGDHVKIGKGSFIGENVVIQKAVQIGDHATIHPNCVISHALIGDHVQLFPGVKIGQSGFGYAMDPRGHVSVPQLGRVCIGHHVEIGANSAIDRGSWKDTIIGDGCVIDNQVMIAHNVELGRGCVLAAQVGISGSTKLGDFVVMGGQAGTVGHIEIGSGVQVGAQCGVTKSLQAGIKVNGTPAMPLQKALRKDAILKKIGNNEISFTTKPKKAKKDK